MCMHTESTVVQAAIALVNISCLTRILVVLYIAFRLMALNSHSEQLAIKQNQS